MKIPARVRLREVAPRDGFQSLPHFIPTEKKLEIVRALVEAGVREVEATSFVSPRAVPQLRDAAELMAQVPRERATYAALVPNLEGARKAAAVGVDQLVVVISASEAHNLANVRRSIADSLADLDPIFELARESSIAVIGAVAVSLGCPYQGEVPHGDVFRIVEAYFSRGAVSTILADTAGMATPLDVESLVKRFVDRYPGRECILHFHNNRGTAMANLLAALLAGATAFDTALGGIGGCPNVPKAAGNLPTEDVVCMLEGMGIETGVDLQKAIRASLMLEEIAGVTLPGQVIKSGPRRTGAGKPPPPCCA